VGIDGTDMLDLFRKLLYDKRACGWKRRIEALDKKTTALLQIVEQSECDPAQTGDVRFLFISDNQKNWQPMLCTDLKLKESQILSYFARRWSIEVFFKYAKQMLYMAQVRSNTFDALDACHSLVMIRSCFWYTSWKNCD